MVKLPIFRRSFLSSGLQGFRSARQEARRRLDDSLKHLASDTDENPPVACTVTCLGGKWLLYLVVIWWLHMVVQWVSKCLYLDD